MIKNNFKKIVIILSTLAIFIVIVNAVVVILKPKTSHGVKQADYMYSQPKDTIDVVFMGSSHIHCDINTKVLWDKYGIAAYDYSAAEQPLWITYYYLEEICKYQSPKLIVLDLFSPARFKDDFQYHWLPDNLNGVRFSLTKIKMACVSSESDKLFNYFPSIFNFHSRYDEVGKDDIKELFKTDYEKSAFKGYTPYFNTTNIEEPEFYEEFSGGLTVKSEIYLIKIIEFAKEHNIDLYLIVSPYYTTNEDETVYNRIHEIAEYYELEFNSTNYFYEEIGLNFDSDFNDPSHLNYKGSCKFSDYIGGRIKQLYDIPDRRGLERWESWNRQEY